MSICSRLLFQRHKTTLKLSPMRSRSQPTMPETSWKVSVGFIPFSFFLLSGVNTIWGFSHLCYWKRFFSLSRKMKHVHSTVWVQITAPYISGNIGHDSNAVLFQTDMHSISAHSLFQSNNWITMLIIYCLSSLCSSGIERQLESDKDERASADLRIRKSQVYAISISSSFQCSFNAPWCINIFQPFNTIHSDFSQHAILAKKFVEVMTKYNEAQMDFRDKSKGRIARQLEISEWQLIKTYGHSLGFAWNHYGHGFWTFTLCHCHLYWQHLNCLLLDHYSLTWESPVGVKRIRVNDFFWHRVDWMITSCSSRDTHSLDL